MEVAYDFTGTLTEGVVKIDLLTLQRLHPRRCWALQWAIDHLGALSTQAQKLRRQLTSYDKLVDSDDEQKLYLMWEKHPEKENCSIIIGMLKVGKKKLFLLNEKQQNYEADALCVLDFFVHESKQRQGFGHVLFDAMLVEEVLQPYQLAIDRPSNPFLCFIQKHYEMKDPVWQSTNFVVFPPFFDDHRPRENGMDRRSLNGNKISSGFHTPSMSEKMPAVSSRPGSRSSSISASPRHAYSYRGDSASGIIHGTAATPSRPNYAPDTPQGRKNTRDFGHTSLW
ncbi:hypothetical protein PENTCL1PPCAC_25623 [Pristionchus entomophagus]|uniref:Alpha-tubulin N-acetyltransferase n=1 Tax=Pristionchus entomophagus TaxID=358040 RepID=A0AAV5UAM6_9BILA|nr:hypothetical protein PENTCL1PPCAC_25623 [Pristionchus entomophagus]